MIVHDASTKRLMRHRGSQPYPKKAFPIPRKLVSYKFKILYKIYSLYVATFIEHLLPTHVIHVNTCTDHKHNSVQKMSIYYENEIDALHFWNASSMPTECRLI